MHAITLGLVASLVAVLRQRLANRHHGLIAAVRGAIVAQPVLHAAAKLFPAPEAGSPADNAAAAMATTALHLLVAAVIVAGVAGSEQLYSAVAARQAFPCWLCVPPRTPVRPRRLPLVAVVPVAPVPRRLYLAPAPRRGPPATRASAF